MLVCLVAFLFRLISTAGAASSLVAACASLPTLGSSLKGEKNVMQI